MSFHVPEKFRLHAGPFASTECDGNNGVFLITLAMPGRPYMVGYQSLGTLV